jgi:hypothetical protein
MKCSCESTHFSGVYGTSDGEVHKRLRTPESEPYHCRGASKYEEGLTTETQRGIAAEEVLERSVPYAEKE